MQSTILRRALSLSVFFLASITTVAQIDKTLNSAELLFEVYNSLQEGDTTQTYKYFHAIHPNDTNYTAALLYEIEILDAQGKYTQSLELADKGIAVEDASEVNFYISKGNSLLDLERPEEALAVYQKASKKYPFNHLLQYNIAISYLKMEKHNEYVEALKKTISINPFYSHAHVELGSIAISKGKISQALMSYAMSILVDPTSATSNSILAYINQAVSEKIEIEKEGYAFPENVDDYSEIDNIITNYVALQKGYKVKSKADLPIIRQLQVLMETMEFDPSDDGYWMQTYVRFYKKLWEEEMFEPFSYYMLRASRNDKHERLVTRKAKKVSKFTTWGGKEIIDYFNTIPLIVRGESVVAERSYGDGDGLTSLGSFDGDKRSGCWFFFHETGAIYGEGCYDNLGLQTGEWKWYTEKGDFSKEFNMKGGELNGKYLTTYEMGAAYQKMHFKDGLRNGAYEEYYKNGGVYTQMNYKEGKRDGEVKYFHENGKVRYSFNRKEDKLHGAFKEFYANSQLKEITKYVDGAPDSINTSYYSDGSLKSTYNFTEGKLEGGYTEYFSNGKVERNGKYAAGTLVGENLDYYSNGELYKRIIYDVDGKLNGLSQEFDKDGIKYLEFDYKKGNIVAYRLFDKQGEITRQAKKKGGEFIFKGDYPDGTRKSNGSYDYKGGREGDWKYYNKNGKLEVAANFENDELNGVRTEYFPNGKVSEEYTYEKDIWKGSAKSFYRNSKLYWERIGEEGSLERGVIQYDRFGDTTESLFYEEGSLTGWQYYYTVDQTLDRKSLYNYGTAIMDIYYDSLEVPVDTLVYTEKNAIELHYPNGQIRFKCTFLNGSSEGEVMWFYPNGKLLTKGQFINGERDGKWESYYTDGKLKSSYSYVMGEKEGVTKDYYVNGEIEQEYTNKNGVLDGASIDYREDGTLTSKFNYSMGHENGEAVFYDPKGVLDHVRYYHYGKIIGYSYLGKNGERVSMIPIVNETAEVKSYFQNGNVSREYKIDAGYFQGEYKKYYSTGEKSEVATYKDNWAIGEKVQYFKNGKAKHKFLFKEGLLDGGTTSFYANGKIKVEKVYKKGSKHGVWKYYSSAGKLTKEEHYYDNLLIEIKEA